MFSTDVTLDINWLKEKPLEVFLENRCSQKYLLKSSRVNLWSKYFKNTIEEAHFVANNCYNGFPPSILSK